MARNQRIIDASPEAVFDVLSDPRSYAYWVVGSMGIRDADEGWPAQGTRIHHTVGIGPLRIRDYSVVEEVRPGRFLQLQAKTRPMGKASVELELERADGGTRVTMIESPADAATAFVFQPLTHLLMRARNVRSLERLAELAEGRRPMPGEEAGATSFEGGVENPDRERRRGGTGRALAQGALSGVAGGLAMTASTNLEMRLRGRPPSDAPANALARVLHVKPRGRRRKQALALAGHFGTSIGVGLVRGALDRAGVPRAPAAGATFAAAMLPEVVVVPALGATNPPWRWSRVDAAVSVLHHAVFAGAADAAYVQLARR